MWVNCRKSWVHIKLNEQSSGDLFHFSCTVHFIHYTLHIMMCILITNNARKHICLWKKWLWRLKNSKFDIYMLPIVTISAPTGSDFTSGRNSFSLFEVKALMVPLTSTFCKIILLVFLRKSIVVVVCKADLEVLMLFLCLFVHQWQCWKWMMLGGVK